MVENSKNLFFDSDVKQLDSSNNRNFGNVLRVDYQNRDVKDIESFSYSSDEVKQTDEGKKLERIKVLFVLSIISLCIIGTFIGYYNLQFLKSNKDYPGKNHLSFFIMNSFPFTLLTLGIFPIISVSNINKYIKSKNTYGDDGDDSDDEEETYYETSESEESNE